MRGGTFQAPSLVKLGEEMISSYAQSLREAREGGPDYWHSPRFPGRSPAPCGGLWSTISNGWVDRWGGDRAA